MQLPNVLAKPQSKDNNEEYEDIKMLDLVFLMDSTGSMGSYIDAAKRNVVKIAADIQQSEKISAEDLRMCLIAYRDHPPQDKTFVVKKFDFTSDPTQIQADLSTIRASGGGDGPEAVTAAMDAALNIKWRPNAAKIIVLIADAPPHGLGEDDDGFPNGDPNGLDPLLIARTMAERGIVIYPVACEPTLSTYYSYATDFFRSLATITGGLLVPLTSAALLTKAIVGGAQEQLDLEKLVKELGHDAARKVAAGKSEEEVAKEMHEELEHRGYKTWQLDVDNVYEDNEDADRNVGIWASAMNLKEAKSQVKKITKTRLKSNYSTRSAISKKKKKTGEARRGGWAKDDEDEEDEDEEEEDSEDDEEEKPQSVKVSNGSVSARQVSRLVKQSVSRRWDEK